MRAVVLACALGLMLGLAGCRSATPAADESETAAAMPPGMDKEKIRQTVRAHLAQVRDCYEARVKEKPGLQGKLVLQWHIVENGKVSNVRIVRSLDEKVDDCIATAVENWTFPESPPAGTTSRVVFPFHFSQTDSE